MATDGVKIIDGDTAHDTYWGFMDLYDNGVEIDVILSRYPLIDQESMDDFENEIYVTSCALAYWETGQMTEERLNFVREIILKNACVEEWRTFDEKAGKARKKVLDSFLNKICVINAKPRARKKYRKITNLFFQNDDLLCLQLPDQTYRVLACTGIDQYRGACDYIFTPLNYQSKKKPHLSDIIDSEIFGRRIPALAQNRENLLTFQPGIDRVWEYTGGKATFCFGLVQWGITHKDLSEFKSRFEKIGSLKIHEGLKRSGSLGYESSYENIAQCFSDINNSSKSMGYETFPVRVICELT